LAALFLGGRWADFVCSFDASTRRTNALISSPAALTHPISILVGICVHIDNLHPSYDDVKFLAEIIKTFIKYDCCSFDIRLDVNSLTTKLVVDNLLIFLLPSKFDVNFRTVVVQAAALIKPIFSCWSTSRVHEGSIAQGLRQCRVSRPNKAL
jgi:hypothetical protein